MVINLETLMLFMIPVWVLAFSPGPGMLYVTARTLSQGKMKGLFSILGLETGTFLYVILSMLGVSAILLANPHLINILEILGAGYLTYLGVTAILRTRSAVRVSSEVKISKRDSHWDAFIQGIVTNILNPKVALFFIAFLPPFIDPTQDVNLQFLILGIIFILAGVVVNLLVVFLVDNLKQKFVSRLKSESVNHYATFISAFIFLIMAFVIFIRLLF